MNLFRIRPLSAICVFIISTFLSGASYGQSAQEIVAKHIEALGGKERLQSINSVFIEGVAVMNNGTEIDTKLWKVYDRLYRQEISFGMGSVVTIVTPSRGWISSPRSNGEFKSLPSAQLKALQPQIDPAGPLADYAAKGCRVDLDGKDTVRGNPCYRIRLSCPMGQFVTYFIDMKTYYILKETRKTGMMWGGDRLAGMTGRGETTAVMAGGANAVGGAGASTGAGVVGGETPTGDFSIEFSDYKKTADGYIFPYTIVTGISGAKMNVERVEVNRKVDVDGLSRPR